jgi:hypothetical protein
MLIDFKATIIPGNLDTTKFKRKWWHNKLNMTTETIIFQDNFDTFDLGV